MEQKEPLLSFEFADSNGKINPFTFQNPLRVITAHKIEEVIPSFQLVQKEVENGYYAAGFLSYESSPAFDSAYRVKGGSSMPLLWFGIFSEPEHEYLNSAGELYTIRMETFHYNGYIRSSN